MYTHNIKVTGTIFSPFDNLSAYDICDGGYILDPMASPLSFYYGLSTCGGLQNISLNNLFSVNSQELSPQSLFFKTDGTKAYVLGTISDRVYEYKLTTPWDIGTAVYGSNFYSINSQETVPTGLFFKDNGLMMYLLGVNSDSIYQYSLTNAWDISSTAYTSKNFSVGSEENQPRGLYFKSDGLKVYIVGNDSKRIHQYSLGTPWDISTASYSTKYFSVSNQQISPQGLSFKSDGSKTYVVGFNGEIIEYDLSIPWDISTASFNSNYLSVSSNAFQITDIYMKSDGFSFYIIANDVNEIINYKINYNSWELPLSGNDIDIIFDYNLNGGSFNIAYNDLSNIKQKNEGNYIFCESEVNFDFSEFDQTVSKIIKIIFNPNNGSELQKFTTDFLNGGARYPVLSSIKAKYYPSDLFYTYYYPNFIISYEDGTSINLTIPLTSIQCGIFDSYKNRKITESLIYDENKSNILLFINDENDNNMYIGDIYTRLPFILSANLPEKDIELPNLIKPVPVGSNITSIEEGVVSIPAGRKNPVIPPNLIYIYSEYDGISIYPNNSFFNKNELFDNIVYDTSLIITSGGAPYFAGIGVTINVISDLNN